MAKDKKSKKPKPVVEEAADEVEDDELEELDEDDAADAAPKKSKDDEVVFGVSDIAKIASKGREKPIKPRDLRTLLRKMARDGRLDREITAGNRARWAWSGPEDPEVKKILKALAGGELEQGKKEALDKLKADKAKKQAEKDKAAKKAAKAKAKDEDEDDDEDE